MLSNRTVDLLVLGSGAAGMTTALTASLLGLDVLLVESTDKVGGTTSRSAGSVWVPNSRHSPAGSDSPEKALRYLRACLGNRLDEHKMRVFLDAGPEMVAFLEDNTAVAFRAYKHHPDYLATLEGATLAGRVLEPVPFDASVLGAEFINLRPPLPEFTVFGGMMVDRTDIGHLLNATRSFASLRHSAGLMGRYGADRLRFPRGTRLVMGNALAGRLYHSLLQRQAPVLLSTETISLIESDGRIAGARLQTGGALLEVHSRGGVVLATGGFSHNAEMRGRYLPQGVSAYSPVADGATGSGAALAEGLGGQLTMGKSNAFWSPVSVRRRRDGSMAVFPHLVLDRGKPGIVAVDRSGKRFVSEAVDYHRFTLAMLGSAGGTSGQPCFLVCDDTFIAKYGLGMVRPRRMNLRGALADGYVTQAPTMEALARAIGVPAEALADTIAHNNAFAHTGVDEDFGKGSDAYQRNLGDTQHNGPSPCIGPIREPPFYAVAIHASDIGTSCGLVANADGQVLREDGAPIAGLYTCGNDMASIMAGIYPGPGITLGPAMTFGYIVARRVAADVKSRP